MTAVAFELWDEQNKASYTIYYQNPYMHIASVIIHVVNVVRQSIFARNLYVFAYYT